MRRREFIAALGGVAVWRWRRAQLTDLGSVPMPMTPANFAKLIITET